MKIELKDIQPEIKIQASFCPMENNQGGLFNFFFWCNTTEWFFEPYTETSVSDAKFTIDISQREKLLGTITFTAENKDELKIMSGEKYEKWEKDSISWLFYNPNRDLSKFVYERRNVEPPV